MKKGKSIDPDTMVRYEHLEFVVNHTTPSQRLKGLEDMWLLWRAVRNKLPKKIVALQDNYRHGLIRTAAANRIIGS